jgi:hypothetical protein
MDLSENLLIGTIPNLGDLKELNRFQVEYTDMGGRFPDLSASSKLGKECIPV